MRVLYLFILVVLFGVVAPIFAAPTSTELVPMRDGTKLVTDIYLPEGNGSWPVLLVRTPYPRTFGLDGYFKNIAPFLGKYVVVTQSTRGRFGSEGKNAIIFTDDGWGVNRDGADCAEWILKQPWCNGKIIGVGISAPGIMQYLLTGAAPKGVKCQFVALAPCDLYSQCFFQGGALRSELVDNWLNKNGIDQAAVQAMKEHPSYDAMWRGVDLKTRFSSAGTPILHVSGWYDIFQQGTIDAFVGLQNNGGPGARGNQKLIIGPSTHGALGRIGEFDYPNPLPPNMPMYVLWFCNWLNDDHKELSGPPAVSYYTMGVVGEDNAPGNKWNTSDTWPVPAKITPYYFHENGLLDTDKPVGKKASSVFVSDPNDPVPTIGGCNLFLPAGPMDQRKTEARKDVILFTSRSLDKPLEVTGRVKVKLWVSSSAKDTDFTAKLTDVYPDGRSMLICDGIIRARYGKSFAKPELIEPGKVYQFEIDLWSTSIIFNKGHRIRVAVSGSNSPRFDVNPNTGEPVFKADGKVKATNTIYFDSSHPSAIYLPIHN